MVTAIKSTNSVVFMVTMKLLIFLLSLLCIATTQNVDDFEFVDFLESLREEDFDIVTLAEEIVAYNDDEGLDSISFQCLRDLRAISGLNETWILSLIDSSGKIPHGILRFNLKSIGQYQQCIDTVIREDPIRVTGQHCMLSISPAGNITLPGNQMFSSNRAFRRRDFQELKADFGIRNHGVGRAEGEADAFGMEIALGIGICIPSSCSADAMNAVIKIVREAAGNNTIANLPVNLMIQEQTCTTEKKVELSGGDGATIYFFSMIGLFMLLSTLYDLWYQIIKQGDVKQQNQLWVAFSVYSNTNRLFTPSKNPGPLAALHGIRVFSIMWVVLGHRYAVHAAGPLENVADMMEWLSEKTSSAIITGGTVSVDSFFLMSGVLLSYSFFRSAKIKNTLRDLSMFYVHRILRLTPLLAVMILIYATLLRHYGNGPNQFVIKVVLSEECQKNWWTTLLYIQNYVGEPTCVGQSWYLAVDMQLYVISPLLLYPLLMHKTVGIIWVSFCIFIAQATAFVISYLHKWPAGLTQQDNSYTTKFYFPTHTRATPYFIGLLAGYLLVKSFQRNNIKTAQYKFLKSNVIIKVLVIFGWLVSLALMGLVLIGYFDLWVSNYDPNFHWEDTLYIAFSRTAWSLGLLWIIVACAYGYGGPINWFLSLPMFEIFGRFSYAIYLTHIAIQYCLTLTTNYMRLFTHLNVAIDMFGDIVLSFAFSYVLILSFESPITILEKVLFKEDSKKPPESPPAVGNGFVSSNQNKQAIQPPNLTCNKEEEAYDNKVIHNNK